MQVHETWREEIGFILTVVGFALIGYAIVDFADVVPPFENDVIAWITVILGIISLLIGLIAHFTRPSRVAAKSAGSEEPPAESAGPTSDQPTTEKA